MRILNINKDLEPYPKNIKSFEDCVIYNLMNDLVGIGQLEQVIESLETGKLFSSTGVFKTEALSDFWNAVASKARINNTSIMNIYGSMFNNDEQDIVYDALRMLELSEVFLNGLRTARMIASVDVLSYCILAIRIAKAQKISVSKVNVPYVIADPYISVPCGGFHWNDSPEGKFIWRNAFRTKDLTSISCKYLWAYPEDFGSSVISKL